MTMLAALLVVVLLQVLAVPAVVESSPPSRPNNNNKPLPPPPPSHPLHPSRRRNLQVGITDNPNNNNPDALARLRQHLLKDYDKGTFPFQEIWNREQQEQQGDDIDESATTIATNRSSPIDYVFPRQGLTLEVGLNFHRVFQVDVIQSTADLIVWVRQRWNDPRLKWDPTQFDGVTQIQFWVGEGSGAGGQASEIWTPDLLLWNSETPISQTLVDVHAVVDSDGTVFWSRPGHVMPVCKFEGLEDFPFETLGCTMELGSWSFSGLYLRPTKMDGTGYSVGGSETAGEAFAEFSLEDVDCEEHIYPPYPTDPESDWPVLLYHVSFRRSWRPYARGYLVLQVILNICAFCCFWLPPHIGERMGLNITAMLAAVASELVVAANVPAASEMTWFAKFSIISLLFSTLALIESAAVIYFHYHTGDDLVPGWFRWIQRKVTGKQHNTQRRSRGSRNLRCSYSSHRNSNTSTNNKVHIHNKNNLQQKGSSMLAPTTSLHFSSMSTLQTPTTSPKVGNINNTSRGPFGMPGWRDDSDHSEAKRSVTFALDKDNDDEDHSEAKRSVTFALDQDDDDDDVAMMEMEDREAGEEPSSDNYEEEDDEIVVEEALSTDLAAAVAAGKRANGGGGNGTDVHSSVRSSRPSLDAIAESFRTRKSIKTILGRDADDFKNAKEMENNVHWQKVACAIDDFSRLVFPVAFSVALMSVLAKAENL